MNMDVCACVEIDMTYSTSINTTCEAVRPNTCYWMHVLLDEGVLRPAIACYYVEGASLGHSITAQEWADKERWDRQ